MSDSDQETRLPKDAPAPLEEVVESTAAEPATEEPAAEESKAEDSAETSAAETETATEAVVEESSEPVAAAEAVVEEAAVEESAVEEVPAVEATPESPAVAETSIEVSADEIESGSSVETELQEDTEPETPVETSSEVEPTPEAKAEGADATVAQSADEKPEAGAETGAEANVEAGAEASAEASAEVSAEVSAEASADSRADAAAEPPAEDAEPAGADAKEAPAEAPVEAKAEGEAPKKAKKKRRKKKPKPPAEPVEESEELKALRRARDEKIALQGRVFGWNDGGFHIAIGEIPAFCPRSEIKASPSIGDPASYIDQVLPFRVLKIQGGGKRIVVSHAVLVREHQAAQRKETMQALEVGGTATGKISSLADFGAFVDLGGVEGLVHISEISRQRVEKPGDVLELGQEVEVKVLKVEKGGRRISLSIKALQPDPWRDIKERFEEGSIVTGIVERTGRPGAFIELEPGLTGLLPTSEMSLPRDAIPARLYPPGKEVKVMIAQVDTRRRRVALVPEGSAVGGSRADFVRYVKEQKTESGEGFNAMAKALSKFKK